MGEAITVTLMSLQLWLWVQGVASPGHTPSFIYSPNGAAPIETRWILLGSMASPGLEALEHLGPPTAAHLAASDSRDHITKLFEPRCDPRGALLRKKEKNEKPRGFAFIIPTAKGCSV